MYTGTVAIATQPRMRQIVTLQPVCPMTSHAPTYVTYREGLRIAKHIFMGDLHRATGDEALAADVGQSVLHLEGPVQVHLTGRGRG